LGVTLAIVVCIGGFSVYIAADIEHYSVCVVSHIKLLPKLLHNGIEGFVGVWLGGERNLACD
jgi:hypothetical protein